MFADDTKLLKVIKSDRDNLDFQSDLDRLHHWSSTWQLKFNPNKCKIMHAGRQREEHLYTMINDENDTRTILEETPCEKDLGLHVDNQLLFDDHIHQACKKANVMGAIRRTFKHLDIHTLPLLYKAMVRPILEYGNTAGYPHLIRQANKIEQVQRRATNLIPSLTNLPYEQRLKKLNLPSIAFRQLRGDMIQVYKYLSRKYNTPPLVWFGLGA